jgi:hypothetical protein
MPIAAADIKWRLSGGAANADPNASLGGVASSVDVVDASARNLFDDVFGGEAGGGDVEYRCVYIVNGHATLTLSAARIYVSVPTSSPGTEFDIGLDPAAVNADAPTIADENTAPAGVAFTRPSDYTGGLQLNGATGLAPGARKAVWIRRTVTAGAAVGSDSGTLKVEGDTPA